MARIRSIKPDFWNDEKMGQEPEQIMLTFIGLWNFSDDYGVVRSNPVWLKNQIYPYKDKLRIDTFSSWLKRLEELEAVIPVTYNCEGFYCIRTFRKHQKVDKPSKARNCPEDYLIREMKKNGFYLNEYREFINSSENTPRVLDECSRKEGDIGDGKGDGDGRDSPTPIPASLMKEIEILKTDCLKDRVYFVEHVARQCRVSPESIPNLLEAFNAYLMSIGETVKGARDYRQHAQNWIKKQDMNKYNPKTAQTVAETMKRLGL